MSSLEGLAMIRIVIAEKQPMLSEAMESLLHLEEDMRVIGKADNATEALALVHERKPDVLILDIDMVKNNDILSNPNCKIIVLATFANQEESKRVVQAGTSGFLKKDNPSEILTNAIRSVMKGQQILEPELIENSQEEEYNIDENTSDTAKNKLDVKAYVTSIFDKIKQPSA
jgi:two-component system, NarL family, response regulator DesR